MNLLVVLILDVFQVRTNQQTFQTAASLIPLSVALTHAVSLKKEPNQSLQPTPIPPGKIEKSSST